MAVNKDEQVLLDFYLYSDLNDEHYLNQYLEERYLDIGMIAENLNVFLQQKQAELKLAKGREFRENYLEALGNSRLNETEREIYSTADSEMICAYRKASGNTEEEDADIQDDLKKINILKKLTSKNQPPTD